MYRNATDPVAPGRPRVLQADERAVLEQVCAECHVPADLVEALIQEEERVYLMGRRHGIHERIDGLLNQYLMDSQDEGDSQ